MTAAGAWELPTWDQLLAGPAVAGGMRPPAPRHARAWREPKQWREPDPWRGPDPWREVMGWREASAWTAVAASGALVAVACVGQLLN